MRKILEQLYSRPWFATPGVYKSVERVVKAKMERSDIEERFSDYFVHRSEMDLSPGGIATIDVSGVLGKKLSNIEKACGACDYNDLLSEIAMAGRMGAKGYIFSIDSGGGMASGCAEVAAAISKIEAPTYAFIDSIGCSAAYWIASACDKILASESAQVGSIGVIIPWIDAEEFWALNGLEFNPITNEGATLKSAGYGPTLTDEQRTHLTQGANDMAAAFQGFVMENRPQIDPTVWKAGTFVASRALELGLVDQVGGLEEAKAKLSQDVDTREKNKFTKFAMPETTNSGTTTAAAQAPASAADVATLTNRLEAAENELATTEKRLDEMTTRCDALASRCEKLATRCEELSNQVSTTQRAMETVPTEQKITEIVDKRFIAQEAARGHGSPIRQPQGADGDDPKERARARTRSNPAVLHFVNGGRD